MTRFLLLFVFAIALPVMTAQETVPQGFEIWTAESLKQLQPTLHADAAKNPHHISTQRLVEFAHDAYMVSYREADGVVEWHENQADIFFVQSGSATLVVGASMMGGDTIEPHEKRNGTIQGPVRRKLSAGDVVRIPAKIPHQLLLDGSGPFTYFVVKVKGYE